MVKKNNKGITLDELANMVARGFEGVDKKFESVATKEDVRTIEKRLGRVEFQVDEIYDILKHFEENDILNLQKRVQILEKAVRALATSQGSK